MCQLGDIEDTSIQCVTLGMIASLSPTPRKLTAGSGRVATVFVSSLEQKPIENLSIDTTLTRPGNRLMSVLQTSDDDVGEVGPTARSLKGGEALRLSPNSKDDRYHPAPRRSVMGR